MVKYNADNLNDVFSVLSDPTRRSIIEQLSKGERSVQELAEPFDMSLPAISKHLKVLENAGLVTKRKEGRYRYYAIKPDSMENACEWMDALKEVWSRFEGMFGCSKNKKQ
ncbi:ArsR/SmtB family transcription factor [Fictibacillus phosphorivorans]|uniref:ArsR/SmtB family transcription factor n=1 Tax=Fictibacillus phosphorivorans TaxID=1221500 RepID=UPI00203A4C48|nr:metalloregulator ArsR/SmtB family transcription factor [Fictibacillus phosphorivorans]MCM3719916.1 metalloregulator ArsR/SmtB family transcription factor [Fictibacillus phosphorivorans]MCM3777630.1 metalloregulator ArsR/SmtB family transcription factor [Fictibacillus phosphorivorans]